MNKFDRIKEITDFINCNDGFPTNWLSVVEMYALSYEGIYDLLELYMNETCGFERLDIMKDIIQMVEEVR